MDKNSHDSATVPTDLPVKIKEEPEDDIKDYAETTMNELLGLYGYDKVSSSETENLRLQRYRAEDSVNGEADMDDVDDDDDSLDGSASGCLTPDDLESGRHSATMSESSLAAQHRNLVSALNKRQDCGTPGLSDSSSPSSYIVCAWCQKTGMKLFTLKSSTGLKAFCSEICFTQCRRASFKKNKVCDWCKHVRHTVNFVDFQDGDQQLQFCSSKCLNQYKMNIFCKETQEHLKQMQQIGEDSGDSASPCGNDKQILITPELWLSKRQEHRIKLENNDEEDHCKSRITDKHSPYTRSSSSSSRRYETSSGADRFAKDRERLRRAIRESRDSGRSSSPPRSGRQSPPKQGQPGSLGFPPWPHPSHLLGGLGPGMVSLGMFNPMMLGGIFDRPPLLPTDAPTSEKHRERSHTVSGPHLSSPAPSPSSACTTPNQQRTPSAVEGRSISAHNGVPPLGPNLPRGNFGSGVFPYGGTPGPVPPFVFGEPQFGNSYPPMLGPLPPGQLPHPGIPAPPPGNGVPPVTVLVPFPVLLPVPVPIPLPLPITPEKLMKFFKDKQAERNSSTETKVNGGSDEVNDHESASPVSSTTPVSPRVLHPRENSLDSLSTSRDSVSNGCLDYSSFKTRLPQRSESAEPALTLKDSKSSYLMEHRVLKRSLTPTTAKSLDLTKRPKLEARDNESGAIDLSKDSCLSLEDEIGGKENFERFSIKDLTSKPSKGDGAEELNDPITGIRVPKIHIVSTSEDPPLASQQLPLPPTDHAYSLRRSLILDAPNVPKQQKNAPYQDRPYVRSVPRDMIEAARRRCLRARVRTK